MRRSPRRVGVEREHTVRDERGDVVDMRTIIDALGIDGRRLDPDDPHAHRCRWGGVITADGHEVEVVTPPVLLGPGAIEELEGLSRAGDLEVRRRIATGWTLHGYSTHISVEVDDSRVVATARLLARRLSPALALLADRRDGPGILVRARHQRVEVGLEFLDGEPLRRAIAVSVALVQLAEDAARHASIRRSLPAFRTKPVPAVGRFGWYVDRRLGGVDLYDLGRGAQLRGRWGRRVRAQGLVEAIWSVARSRAAGLVDDALLDAVDDLVADQAVILPTGLDAGGGQSARVRKGPDVVSPRRRGPVEVEAVAATWLGVHFEVRDAERRGYVSVPEPEVVPWLEALEAGELDRRLGELLSLPT